MRGKATRPIGVGVILSRYKRQPENRNMVFRLPLIVEIEQGDVNKILRQPEILAKPPTPSNCCHAHPRGHNGISCFSGCLWAWAKVSGCLNAGAILGSLKNAKPRALRLAGKPCPCAQKADEMAGLGQGFQAASAYAICANTSAAIAIVSSTSSAVCAADIKLASYADGPSATPRSSSPWKKVLNAAMLEAAMSL